jgi:hypothetical protein
LQANHFEQNTKANSSTVNEHPRAARPGKSYPISLAQHGLNKGVFPNDINQLRLHAWG